MNTVHSAPCQRILAAARDLQQRSGAHALSMRSVARRAGLTAPAIYVHFTNKNALLDALAEQGFAELERRFAAVRETDPDRRVRSLLTAFRAFALEEPEHHEVMFELRRDRTRCFPDDFAQGKSHSFSILTAAIAAAIQTEAYRPDDPLEVGLTLWAMVQGLLALHRVGRFGPSRHRFERLYDRSIDRALAGIRKP